MILKTGNKYTVNNIWNNRQEYVKVLWNSTNDSVYTILIDYGYSDRL